MLLAAQGAEAKLPPKLLGKAFVLAEKPADQDAAALAKICEKAPPVAELQREKGQNGHWVGNLVAFFRKPSVKGPVIIWIYDKADKQSIKDGEPIQALSVDTSPKDLFLHELDLDPDQGYNKDRTYLIRVGQLIGKKERVYAVGEVKLLKK